LIRVHVILDIFYLSEGRIPLKQSLVTVYRPSTFVRRSWEMSSSQCLRVNSRRIRGGHAISVRHLPNVLLRISVRLERNVSVYHIAEGYILIEDA